MQRVQTKVNQKGFTLLELLIAISLLAIGLLAVATMQTTAINANVIANKNTSVASLAQEVMEDILSWNPDPTIEPSFSASSANVTYDLDPNTAGNSISLSSAGTYSAQYSITRDPVISGATVTQFVQIDVTVTGGNKTLNLTSYKRLL